MFTEKGDRMAGLKEWYGNRHPVIKYITWAIAFIVGYHALLEFIDWRVEEKIYGDK